MSKLTSKQARVGRINKSNRGARFMKMPIRYDHKTKVSVTEDYRSGAYSYRELSDKYGIAVSTIRQWVLKAGITPSKKKYRNGEKPPTPQPILQPSSASSGASQSTSTQVQAVLPAKKLAPLEQTTQEVSRMKALERRRIQLEIELSTLRSLL